MTRYNPAKQKVREHYSDLWTSAFSRLGKAGYVLGFPHVPDLFLHVTGESAEEGSAFRFTNDLEYATVWGSFDEAEGVASRKDLTLSGIRARPVVLSDAAARMIGHLNTLITELER